MSLNENNMKKIVGIKDHGRACQHCDTIATRSGTYFLSCYLFYYTAKSVNPYFYFFKNIL